MKSDIEIAQEAKMKPIAEIAAGLGLADEDVIPYGRYKAKINHRLIHNAKKQGKLILVTAISPTPAGEGKTTTSVGLADAMNALGKKTMLCLREPSLGPVFGIKGGAAGGGCVGEMGIVSLFFPEQRGIACPVIASIGALVDPPATCINASGDTVASMIVARFVEGKDWFQKKQAERAEKAGA